MLEISFHQIADRIAAVELPKIDIVIGIADGGLVPASLIAYKLGAEFKTIKINFRDKNNSVLRENPKLFSDIPEIKANTVLIVDDVSVTGKTLSLAKELFAGNNILTLTLKGKADFVLFPEISDCVNWPWKAR